MSLILVTGGARSGKSSWAEQCAAKLSEQNDSKVFYIATAEIRDMEMRLRVAQHRKQRPREWKTIEAPKAIAAQVLRRVRRIPENSVFILDCITLLVSNVMTSEEGISDPEKAEQTIRAELRALLLLLRDSTIIMVTNELGSGIVPNNELARTYRDVAGRINQWLASQADQMWFIVSGMALPMHKLATPVMSK
ncbi:MAG: bifunctional adenosylcobinamide kinase/adenosylcobinamide-phosphate guanylyltransferase [Ardenticatenaceae bacterium]